MSNLTMDRLAINNFTYRRYSFNYFMESAKRLGVSQIELSGCHPHFTIYEAENFDVKGLAKSIKDAGFTVPAIEPEQNFLPVNIAASNEYLRNQSIEQLKFYIQNAHEFDCDKVIVYPGKAFMNYPHSEAWKHSRESVFKLSEYAKEHDVTILLEGVSKFISDLMMDAATVKRMMDEVGNDNIGCCVNSSAATLAGETLEDYFVLMGDRIGIIQLSDSVEDNDQLVWGEGDQDLKKHLDTLDKYDYQGAVALEVIMEEYAYEAEKHYRNCISYVKKYIG